MRETVPRIQRVYLRFEDAGHGMMRLAASLTPPTYDEPVMVLLSRGVMPLGQPISLLLVSDPSQVDALRGKEGDPGKSGASAYQSARSAGYGGTETQWLASLTGAAGASAYQLARAAGYGGTMTQWLASLAGAAGKDATTLLGTIVIGETADRAPAGDRREIFDRVPGSALELTENGDCHGIAGMTPAYEDLRAYRWTPMVALFPFEGLDMTGATCALDVRLYQDAPGAALVALSMAASNAQGLSLTVEWDADVPTSIVQARINETTLEALLPFPANGTEPGDVVRLVYDLHITMPDFGKRRWVEGAFIIVPGATH